MQGASKIRLKQVRLEGFRGVNKPITLDCGDAATLLLASNGKGKTSILGGIEWCLFGRLNFQPAENGTNDELVNLHHPRSSAKVELSLVGNGLEYTVTRERKIRKRETTLGVRVSNGQGFEGQEAEAFLFRLLGLTWEDFSRAVFLHQESVRGLLTDTPEIRDATLDRLFGLEKLRNVSAAIPMKVVTDAVQEVQRRATLAAGRLEGAAEQVEQQRERHLADAKEKGFTEATLTLADGLTIARGIASQLDAVSKANEFELPPTQDPKELEDLERVARRAKDATKDMRIAVARASPTGETAERMGQLDLFAGNLKLAERQVSETKTELEEHQKKWGDERELSSRKTELAGELGKLERDLELLGVKDRILSGAIDYLKVEPHAKNCPVCAQGINPSKLSAELERQVRSVQTKESRALHEEREKVRASIAETEQAARDDLQLRRAAQRATEGLGVVVREIEGVLSDATDPDKAKESIETAQKTLREKLAEQNKFHAMREGKFQEIDEKVEALRALYRFLKTDEKFDTISAKAPDAKEGEPIQQELDGLLALQESLQQIGRAINEVAKSRASGAVEESRPGIESFYKKLCNHPYFDDIRVETEEKNVRGLTRNTYTIRALSTDDRKETLASSRLSTGQMNCVALSIYLALARVLSHNLGFVILDDPSQNLDSEHKVALANILKGLQPNTQLLVASQDAELQGILRTELAGDQTLVYDLSWHPQNGTVPAPVD
jgi:DNA repair protein SbcC/Rad50